MKFSTRFIDVLVSIRASLVTSMLLLVVVFSGCSDSRSQHEEPTPEEARGSAHPALKAPIPAPAAAAPAAAAARAAAHGRHRRRELEEFRHSVEPQHLVGQRRGQPRGSQNEKEQDMEDSRESVAFESTPQGTAST